MQALDRHVRVFVSSTFRDMRAERDELILRIFPRLRKLCESRGVTWSEVDLRWGITDEQVAEGRLLPICLEEIQRCRPFFIGMLGQRYGWVDTSLPEELFDRQPWLVEHARQGKSITELEILHGVLNNPAMAEHALFYFRDPAYADRLPPERRGDFVCASEAEKSKLDDLKCRIEASGLPVRKGYTGPEALGQWVLADLTALIDRLYPQDATPDPLAREAMSHETLLRERAPVFVGRSDCLGQLDAHAAGQGPPLIVRGIRDREVRPACKLVPAVSRIAPGAVCTGALRRRVAAELGLGCDDAQNHVRVAAAVCDRQRDSGARREPAAGVRQFPSDRSSGRA